jgi:drug/metabolite transporter (DMT)-like permease
MVAFAVVEIIGPWWLTSDAEVRLSSSMTGLLITSVPIISVLVARFFGEAERLTTMRLAGLLVGLAGVMLIAIPSSAATRRFRWARC